MVNRAKEAAGEILRLAQPSSTDNSQQANQVILELLRERPGQAVPAVEQLIQELRDQLLFMKPEGRQFLERIIAFLERQLEGTEESP